MIPGVVQGPESAWVSKTQSPSPDTFWASERNCDTVRYILTGGIYSSSRHLEERSTDFIGEVRDDFMGEG